MNTTEPIYTTPEGAYGARHMAELLARGFEREGGEWPQVAAAIRTFADSVTGLTAAALVAVDGEPVPNLPTRGYTPDERRAYQAGHRDARHAAAGMVTGGGE